MNNVEYIIARAEALESQAANWKTLWQDLANYVMPRKSQITERKTPDVEGYTDDIYDTEAIHSCLTLAAGQMDYMVSGRWFEFASPMPEPGRAAKDWYKRCSEIALEVINASNFSMEIHEFMHDRGGFGTAHLHCDEDEDSILSFSNAPVGTFFIAENHQSLVDQVFRTFKLASDRAIAKYGEENCGAQLRADFAKCEASGKGFREFDFIHVIRPRLPSERVFGKLDGSNKPWASVTVCKQDRVVVRDSGFDEQPFVVSRYLKWGDSPYGYCPSIEVLPVIRQRNFIEQSMDALAEVAAAPRVLVPADLEGDVDMRANGITVFDPNNPQAVPREWMTSGRYDIGKDRSNDKAEMIKRAYLIDLFQLLTSANERGREKTAFEVDKMLAEKLPRISPTFDRIKIEVFRPILHRIFGILFRRGIFPKPPEEVIMHDPTGPSIPLPKVQYHSKLALAIKSVENQSFQGFMSMVAPLMEVYGPAVANQLNPARAVRRLADNQGVPIEFFNTPQELAQIEKQQAQQAQQQQAMEMATAAAGAAKDASAAGISVPDPFQRMGARN